MERLGHFPETEHSAMIVSVPAAAPLTLPETGASIIEIDRFAILGTTSAYMAGSDELISITKAPFGR